MEHFSRILSLNTWLLSTCKTLNIDFINNFNLFWNRAQLFSPDGVHPNWLGRKMLTANLQYAVRTSARAWLFTSHVPRTESSSSFIVPARGPSICFSSSPHRHHLSSHFTQVYKNLTSPPLCPSFIPVIISNRPPCNHCSFSARPPGPSHQNLNDVNSFKGTVMRRNPMNLTAIWSSSLTPSVRHNPIDKAVSLDNPSTCKSRRGLGVLHLNIRSLSQHQKLDHVNILVTQADPDILILSE